MPFLHPSRPTALYRLFGEADELLYVGIAYNPEERWRAHAGSKYWWPDVVRGTVEWHATRPAAEAAESCALRSERPRYDDSARQGAGAALPRSAPDARGQADDLAAAHLLAQDISSGHFPAWTVLPRRPILAARYALSETAVSTAIHRTPGVTSWNPRWLVVGPGGVPREVVTTRGYLYVLAYKHLGAGVFSAETLAQSIRLSTPTVTTMLKKLVVLNLVTQMPRQARTSVTFRLNLVDDL
ncbi:hypothetical protein [Streptomyces sp. NPDC087297]|uniref:hypothetical protein n=1 Tax=Streptomyces sp. NPDC087297 TaxID=3365778 RepID=UPI00380AF96E